METSALSATALWLNHAAASSGGTAATNSQLFADSMAQMQLQEEILAHLQGVPMDTVSIPPDIRRRMLEDRTYYEHIMFGLDEYVKAYKQYNAPGVITMSFFVTAEGEYCIRGVNEMLKRLYEAQKEEVDGSGLDGGLPTVEGHPLLDTNALFAHLALAGYDDDRFKRWSWA